LGHPSLPNVIAAGMHSVNNGMLSMYRKCSIEHVRNTLFTPSCYSKTIDWWKVSTGHL